MLLAAGIRRLVLPGWLSLVRPRKGNHSAGLISSNVGDPEVAGSKTPLSETPAPGTYCQPYDGVVREL